MINFNKMLTKLMLLGFLAIGVCGDENGAHQWEQRTIDLGMVPVGNASMELKSADGQEAFLTTDEVSIIGYFEKDDSPLAVSFQAVAKELHEMLRFAHTSAKSLLDKEGLKNNIVLYHPKTRPNESEASSFKYEGRASFADIYEFIRKNYFGLVGIRTKKNAANFNNPLIVIYYGVIFSQNPNRQYSLIHHVWKVAKDFPNINFAISNEYDFQDELNKLSIYPTKGGLPVVVARKAKGKKFVLRSEFSTETLEKFVKDFEAGKLKPFSKSRAITKD